MGCNIHAFAEIKSGEKWRKVGDDFEQEGYDKEKYFTDEVYKDRDYELFAFLADVRNYDGLIPISKPKGIPPDASHGYLHEIEFWGSDCHSYSWFTLEELKDIPSDLLEQEVDDQSLITKKDNNGNIIEICRDTNGKNFGKVGKRKIFKLFSDDCNPIKDIITRLESVKNDGQRDSDIRMVFFFDN